MGHAREIALLAVTAFVLVTSSAGRAAEVKVLSAEVLKHAIEELSGDFERATGHKLAIRYDAAAVIRKQIQGGEAADVAILQKPVMETLSGQGKIARESIVGLGQSGVGLAVRKGAPRPDISSVHAFKRALLNSKSIAYPDPARGAASGIHFRGVIERLGIAREVNAKARLITPPLADFVARNETEIVITQPMELLAVPSLELVGWMPDELQDYGAFTWAAGITANAGEPDAAGAWIRFLSSPAAVALIKRKGMNPVAP
jgi:molybdate transport system substrate-binding protein